MEKKNLSGISSLGKSERNPVSIFKKRFSSIMPLFRKNYTYISPEVSFKGDISAQENIVIDGKMQGNIRAAKHVALGATAKFEGTIECENATVSGDITGSIRTSQTIIVRVPASITGDLISASVQVESGVVLHGKIISSPHETQAEPSTNEWEQTLMHLAEPIENR